MELEKAETLTINLMGQFGLRKEWNFWQFNWDRSKSRFGAAHYKKKIISLSKDLVLLNNEEEVRKTILHEIAHALTGKGNGHNKKWRDTLIRIGGDGRRCYNAAKVISPAPKYLGECKTCNKTIKRHRRLRLYCKLCFFRFGQGKASRDFEFIWKEAI